MSRFAVHNRIMDILLAHQSKWLGSSNIISFGSFTATQRPQILMACHDLANAGQVERGHAGVKRLVWKIKNTNWNRNNPLGANANANWLTAADEDWKKTWGSFTGNTYIHRESFKLQGGRFWKRADGGDDRWYVHPAKVEASDWEANPPHGCFYHPPTDAKIVDEVDAEVIETPANESVPHFPVIDDANNEMREKLNTLKGEYNRLISKLDEQIEKVKDLQTVNDQQQKAYTELLDNKERMNVTLKVERHDKLKYELKDVTLPSVFNTVKDLAECREDILLTGPAGCGKTYLGGLIAKVFKLPFHAYSITAGISEGVLLGRSTPNLGKGEDKYHTSKFVELYEKGGVILLDEIDAGDANTLLILNSALANGYLNVWNRYENPVAKRHKDFILIATANTLGYGATRQYEGRNALDISTLDRFAMGVVEMDYDRTVEMALCPEDNIRHWCWGVRDKIKQGGMRKIMSTRFIEKAFGMHKAKGWGVDEIRRQYLTPWTRDERSKLGELAA